MSRLQRRSSMAGAAVVIALLTSRSADAQASVAPVPPGHPGGYLTSVITGVQYDIANQALAERQLEHRLAKLRRDADRGATAAVNRDLRCIDNLRYRITIDEWLIRWNSCQHYDFYPIRTGPETRAVIAQVASPSRVPLLQQHVWEPGEPTVVPTISITIVNTGSAGADITFDINGATHHALGASRQNLEVPTHSIISYDAGGSLGRQRYLISPGSYEFRSTPEGWTLLKLPDSP